MTGPQNYLAEWFERFIKNRDIIFRKISTVERKDYQIIVVQKDGKNVVYHIEPFVTDFLKTASGLKGDNKGLIVYNTQENFENLLKSWADLEQMSGLTIFFVNPFSKLDKRWAVNPRTHSLITDKEALEPGLRTMFAMVDVTTQREIEQLTN